MYSSKQQFSSSPVSKEGGGPEQWGKTKSAHLGGNVNFTGDSVKVAADVEEKQAWDINQNSLTGWAGVW